MADLGQAYVQIIPSAKGISGQITNALAPESISAGKTAGGNITNAIAAKLNGVGKGLIKGGAVATAISVPIIAGINKALKAYETQSNAETKLTEIYKKRMGVGDAAAKNTMKIAAALQKQGVVSDEVTLSGAQQLATFAKMPSTVNKLLPAMDNLLVQQKGYNATAEDATGIANLMGKVMGGNVGALKRVGISFTEAQEKILKTGTEEEKAAVLAQVITDNVGDMNKTFAQTPLGKIQQMKNSMGDMAEQLGGTLAPVLSDLAQKVSSDVIPKIQQALNFLQNNPAIAEFAMKLTGVLAIGGPLTSMIGLIVTKVAGLIKILPTLKGIMTGAFGGPLAAIAVLVAAFVTLWKTNEKFRNAILTIIEDVKGSFASFAAQFKALLPNFNMTNIVNTLKSLWMGFCNIVAPLIVGAFRNVSIIIKAALAGIIQAITFFKALFSGNFAGAFDALKNIVKIALAAVKALFMSQLRALIGAGKAIWNQLPGPAKAALMTVATVVSNVVKRIMNFFARLKAIVGTVKATFNRVKQAITEPIQKAVEKIRQFVTKIKNLINKMKLKIPKPKIPKIDVNWKKVGTGKLSIKVPSISWRAKGGIMKRPTLFGGGEAGDEGIVPLDPFWKRLDATKTEIDYDRLGMAVASAMRMIQMTSVLEVDGKQIARGIAKPVSEEIDRMQARGQRRLGYV